MTKQDKATLRKAAWKIVGELSASGTEFGSREVVDILEDRYSELIGAAARRLIRASLMDDVNRMIKNMPPHDEYQQLLFLPPEIESLKLPHCITFVRTVHNDQTGVDERSYVLCPLYAATREQLGMHIQLLTESIRRDQRRLRDIVALQRYLDSTIRPEERGEPIGRLLERLAQQVGTSAAEEAEEEEPALR